MLILSASRSHLYPGARGRLVSGRAAEGPVRLDFADGSAAWGRLSAGTGGGFTLHLHAYVTAAGTEIGEKAWALSIEGAAFRVTGRAG